MEKKWIRASRYLFSIKEGDNNGVNEDLGGEPFIQAFYKRFEVNIKMKMIQKYKREEFLVIKNDAKYTKFRNMLRGILQQCKTNDIIIY